MRRIWIVIMLFLPCLVTFADDMAPSLLSPTVSLYDSLDTLSPAADVIVGDSIVKSKNKGIKGWIQNKLNEPYDTTRDDRYWWRALKHGKVDFQDESIHYPAFISWCWNTIQKTNSIINDYDTSYVVSTGKKLKITLKNVNWYDDYDFEDEDKLKILFHSSRSSNIGLSASLMGISAGYQMAFDNFFGRKATSKKFELSFTCSRFSVEYYRLLNTGDMTLTYIFDKEKAYYHHFSGLKRKSWGINAYYFFNHRHYAQAAAYSFSKFQRRNAGSLLAGVSVSHRNFTLLYRDTPEELRDQAFYDEYGDDADDIEETMFDYTDLSLNVGYGYNWVLSRQWLINATALLYSGIKFAHAKSTSDGGHRLWAVSGKLRLGFVYNYGRFFGSLQGYLDSHFFNTGIYKFHSHLYDITATFGIQF